MHNKTLEISKLPIGQFIYQVKLSKTSMIDCFQVRNFSYNRFMKKLGSVEQNILLQAHQTIAKTLDPAYSLVK